LTRYLLRRIASLIPVWLGISFFAFALATIAPGDPAQLILERSLDEPPTPEQLEAFREKNGLNDPFLVQYLRWTGGALRGDLGTSFRSGQPVYDELVSRIPATLQIAIPGILIASTVAVTIGVLSALKRNSVIDHLSRVGALVGESLPSFVLAYLLIIVLAVHLKLLPVAGRGTPQHLILPALALGLTNVASLMRLTRSSMLEVLQDDFIRTGRAMGLARRTLIARYALKNAVIPILTLAALLFGIFITQSIIVETVFAWPGVGRYVVEAIFSRDYAVIRGFVVFTGTLFVLINLAVDVLYLGLDPRVRLGSVGGIGGR
jgi:peptide/nickel transport system permease protein